MMISDAATQNRVLFVDDDPFYRDLAEDALSGANLGVLLAADGEEALTAVAATTVDLVLLDLSLPGRSGFSVLEAIRAEPRHADLPIVVVTGSDDEATIARAFELGATSFLVKPLNWPLFVQHVRFVLASSRARAELRQAQRTAEFMSDLKSRLIGTLVTEFQGPLRTAFGFARLMKQEADGPLGSALYTDWISELHGSLERLNALQLKMLNFGRSLSEHIELKEEVIPLANFASASLEQVAEVARRRGLKLTLGDGPARDLGMNVDPVLLSNALRAVLDNAVKFSLRGSEISLRPTLSADGDLVLTIEDTTPTMGQAQIDDILGVRATTNLRPEAVELSTGLKMARVLLEAHQGQLQMRARGDGMTTTITLPKQRVVAKRVSARPVASSPVGRAPVLRRAG